MFWKVQRPKQNGRLEARGELVPARLEPSHELFELRVAAQLTHAGVVAEERIVWHACSCDATEPGNCLVWLTHLGAGRGQNESRVMKVVVVLSKAGRNLDLALGLLRPGFRGVEKRPYCRNIFGVA